MTTKELCYFLNKETEQLKNNTNFVFTYFPNNVIFHPCSVNLEDEALSSFICEKRNLVEKEGFQFLVNDHKSGKYLTINEYFDLKKEKKMSISGFATKLENKIKFDRSCMSYNNEGTIFLFPKGVFSNSNGRLFNKTIIEIKNEVEKEGYKLVVKEDDKEYSVDEYLVKEIQRIQFDLNNEAEKKGFGRPFIRWIDDPKDSDFNLMLFSTYNLNSDSKEFLIEVNKELETNGYRLLTNDTEGQTVDEYFISLKKPIDIFKNKWKDTFKYINYKDSCCCWISLYGKNIDCEIINDLFKDLPEHITYIHLYNLLQEPTEEIVSQLDVLDARKFKRSEHKTRKELCDEFNKEAKNVYNSSVPYPFCCGSDGSNEIVVYPNMISDGSETVGFNDFITGAEVIVKKHGYKLVVNTRRRGDSGDDGSYNGKDMSTNEYLKTTEKRSIGKLCNELNNSFKEKGISKDKKCFLCSSSVIGFYPRNLDNFHLYHSELYDAKEKVKKEGYNFQIKYNDFICSFDDYVSKFINDFCQKINSNLKIHLEINAVNRPYANLADVCELNNQVVSIDIDAIKVAFPYYGDILKYIENKMKEEQIAFIFKEGHNTFSSANKYVEYLEEIAQGLEEIAQGSKQAEQLIDFLRLPEGFVKHLNEDYPPGELSKELKIKLRRERKQNLLALEGTNGIVGITDIDNPEGVVVYKRKAYGANTAEIYKLGYKVREIKNTSLFQSLKDDWKYLPKFSKYILSASIATILIAPMIHFAKIPHSLSSKTIHQGVLEKVEENKYIFKDGSSFVIENNKVSGIIPKGIDVELYQDIWGNYKFERK